MYIRITKIILISIFSVSVLTIDLYADENLKAMQEIYFYAKKFYIEGKYAKAIKELNAILSLSPGHKESLRMSAKCNYMKSLTEKLYNEAIKMYGSGLLLGTIEKLKLAYEKDPRNYQIKVLLIKSFVELGIQYSNENNNVKANENFKMAKDLTDENGYADVWMQNLNNMKRNWIKKGQEYFDNRQYESAIKEWRRILKYDSEDTIAQNKIGIAKIKIEEKKTPSVSTVFFEKSKQMDLEISGKLENRYQVYLKPEHEYSKIENWLKLKLRKGWYDFGSFVDFDVRREYVSSTSDDISLFMKEAYIRWIVGPVDFRLGKQIVIWGQADEYNPIDLINPEDYSEFIILDKKDRKIGSNLLKVNYNTGNYSLESIFIPQFDSHSIPIVDSLWIPEELKVLSSNNMVTVNSSVYPENKIENSEIAVKLSGIALGFDLGIMYFDGFSDYSVMYREIDPVDNTVVISPEFRKFKAYGFEFAKFLGNLGMRGEAVYFDKQYFSVNDSADIDGIYEKPSLQYIVGMDYIPLYELYFNVQYYRSQIIEYSKEISDEEFVDKLILKVSDKSLSDDFEIGMTGIFNIEDYMLKLYTELSLTDILNIELGAYFLDGEADTLFGQYDDNDFLFVCVKYFL